MKNIVLIATVLMLFSCDKKVGKKVDFSKDTDSIFELDSSNYVIIQYDKNIHGMFKGAEPTDLLNQELIEAEELIERCINENNDSQRKIVEENNNKNINSKFQMTKTGYEIELKKYKRQYITVINGKGEKEIWINFFCDEFGTGDISEVLVVDDGGSCYFTLKINLSRKSYYELLINGYA